MRKNILILIVGVFLLVVGVFVFAQGVIPPGLVNVFGPVPLVSCSESDGGANIYVQGFNSVAYLGSNGTVLNASAADYCLNGLLVEGVCSSWINANFNLSLNTSGYAVTFNCNASNTGNTTYICLQGACLPQTPTNGSGGGNNTNTSLPDLTVLSLNYTYTTAGINSNTSNGTIYNYNVTFNSVIRNNGTVVAGNSITRIALFGSTSVPQTFNVPNLSPNQNFVINTQPFFATSGTQTASSVADINSSVTESNENNNALIITFTLP